MDRCTEYHVPLNKANAAAAAVTAGEPFAVTVVVDDQPRVVTVPDDLVAAIGEAGVRERWDGLTHR